MKKKIAVLMMFIVSSLSILTGCNLFNTNNFASLSSIVAVSGDVEITKEELITAYNSSGYYYAYYYGLSQEESVKRTINDLIDQKYLLKYIDSQGSKYELNKDDYNMIVSQTWEYLDSSIVPYIKEVRKSFGLDYEDVKSEAEKKEPEFAPQKQYKTEPKFEKIGNKIYYVATEEKEKSIVNENFANEDEALYYAKEHYKAYALNNIVTDNKDYVGMIWARFMTALKSSQKSYSKNKDFSDKASLDREIERVFELNVKNRKLTKFEKKEKKNADYLYDETAGKYYLNEFILGNMVKNYTNMFKNNYTDFTINSNNKDVFYKKMIDGEKRKSIVYFGDRADETFITCSHILVKLSQEQINEIKAIEEKEKDKDISKPLIDEVLARTYVTERDITTGEDVLVLDESTGEMVKKQILLDDMYASLKEDMRLCKDDIEEKTRVFNEYVYRYNMDPGIVNAEFDYVVGTKNSAMVESFTKTVRKLYDNGNGKVGSISAKSYEQNSNYSGYHIVLYTGTLTNLFNSIDEVEELLTVDTIYDYLNSQKTSVSYNETMFENIFDKTVKDEFASARQGISQSLRNGIETKYNQNNFKDLY